MDFIKSIKQLFNVIPNMATRRRHWYIKQKLVSPISPPANYLLFPTVEWEAEETSYPDAARCLCSLDYITPTISWNPHSHVVNTRWFLFTVCSYDTAYSNLIRPIRPSELILVTSLNKASKRLICTWSVTERRTFKFTAHIELKMPLAVYFSGDLRSLSIIFDRCSFRWRCDSIICALEESTRKPRYDSVILPS